MLVIVMLINIKEPIQLSTRYRAFGRAAATVQGMMAGNERGGASRDDRDQ
jgi:hypothetical protein